MTKRIIYQNADGGVSVIIPAPDSVAQYGIEAIALKDVPAGKPFRIVSASEIPTDRSQRNAWQVDAVDLTDGVGAAWNTFDGMQQP